MTPVTIKELELSQTYVWSSIDKERDYIERMDPIYAKLLCAYENCGDVTVFDQNKILIADLWNKEKSVVPKNEFLYRLEKILMLYEHWHRTNKWLTPLVAVNEGERYRIHPGRDRWYVMNHLKVPRYQFLIISQVNYQTLNQISGLWPDKRQLTIRGKEVANIFHNYDKSEVYQYRRISSWLNSGMTFKDFARSTPRQRSIAAMVNKKGP